MANAWERQSNGLYRCHTCLAGCEDSDVPAFDPGGADDGVPTSCACAADTGVSGVPRSPAVLTSVTSAAHAVSSGLLSVVECERRLEAISRAQRRLRKEMRDVLCEDELVKSGDKPGTWREAWRAHHSKLSMLSKHLAEERKSAVAELEAALRRERLDEVARKERLAKALLAIRAGRTDEAETLLAEGSAN